VRWAGVAALVAVAVAFLLAGIDARASFRGRKKLRAHVPGAMETVGRDAGSGNAPRPGRVRARLERSPLYLAVEAELESRGLAMRCEVLLGCCAWVTLLLPLSCFMVTGLAVTVPLSLSCLMLAPRAAVKTLARRREAASARECDAFVADLALYLRSGIPLDDALVQAARESDSLVRSAVADYSSGVRVGRSAGSAFSSLVDTLGSTDLALIGQAVSTSRETGSDIRGIMDTVGETIRERAAVSRELSTQTVQARLSGRIVAALPLVFLLLSAIASRSTLTILLGTTRGLVMLGVAAVMNAAGFLWIRKILDIG